jgi:hypothetical protein
MLLKAWFGCMADIGNNSCMQATSAHALKRLDLSGLGWHAVWAAGWRQSKLVVGLLHTAIARRLICGPQTGQGAFGFDTCVAFWSI